MVRRLFPWLIALALCASAAGPSRAASDTALRLSNVSGSNTAYVRIPNSAAFALQKFTLEAWVQRVGPGYGFTTDGGGSAIIAKPFEGTVGSDIASWHLSWTNAGQVSFNITHTPYSSGIYLGTTAVSTPLGRHHLAATFDGDTARVFVDGVIAAQGLWNLGAVYYDANDVLVGASNFGAGYYRRFDGYIDDVRIWDHALTPAQISGTMNCRLTGTESGLVAYYPFDDSTLTDKTGHGHNAANGGLAGSLAYAPLTPLLVCAPVGVEGEPVSGARQLRMAIFPQPTRGQLTVRFDLPRGGFAQMDLVDVSGRKVGTLGSGYFAAGRHEWARNLRASGDSRLSAGKYLLRLESDGKTAVSPVVLLR